VAFRLTAEERAKLEALAEATQRYPSQVLRLLLDQAELAAQHDVRLRSQPTICK
jgi:hypothetical protein